LPSFSRRWASKAYKPHEPGPGSRSHEMNDAAPPRRRAVGFLRHVLKRPPAARVRNRSRSSATLLTDAGGHPLENRSHPHSGHVPLTLPVPHVGQRVACGVWFSPFLHRFGRTMYSSKASTINPSPTISPRRAVQCRTIAPSKPIAVTGPAKMYNAFRRRGKTGWVQFHPSRLQRSDGRPKPIPFCRPKLRRMIDEAGAATTHLKSALRRSLV
jgi:hypothetical protein